MFRKNENNPACRGIEEKFIKKILNHLSLWDIDPPELWRVKSRPAPKATGPPKPPQYHIDYSISQLPAFDRWLYAQGHGFSVIDPEYAETFPS
jgi:hypothetical protein